MFRWIINAVAVGTPFAIFMLFSDFWNIVLNIWWNHWWAQGNLFLMFNSAYMVLTSVFATFLMFEINVVLRWAKMMRVYVLISAIIYNFFFTAIMLEWVVHVLSDGLDGVANEGENLQFMDLLLHMMTGYSAVLHWPAWAMNCFIIWKEVQLQVFQLVGDLKAPHD